MVTVRQTVVPVPNGYTQKSYAKHGGDISCATILNARHEWMASITLLMVQPMEKKSPVPFGQKDGWASKPNWTKQWRKNSLLCWQPNPGHFPVSVIPVDGKNVFLIIYKGYLMTKFLCAALSVSYTWLTDVRI